jgi:5-methylthioadenosine/S-adenosylhomocysteine deaminase
MDFAVAREHDGPDGAARAGSGRGGHARQREGPQARREGGSLEPGKQADFIALDSSAIHAVPFDDVYSRHVYSLKASDVTDVWVDGRRLLNERRPTTLDEKAIREKARVWRRKIDASLAPAGADKKP